MHLYLHVVITTLYSTKFILIHVCENKTFDKGTHNKHDNYITKYILYKNRIP